MTKNEYIELYKELELILVQCLDDMSIHLNQNINTEVKDYIEFGEYGLAYDLLDSFIKEKNLKRPDELDKCKKMMSI